jgi:hypothetical protein
MGQRAVCLYLYMVPHLHPSVLAVPMTATMYRIRLILGKWYIYIGDDPPIGPMPWSECKAHCKTLEEQGYIKEQ